MTFSGNSCQLLLRLTLFNYGLRFVKWHWYLGVVGVRNLHWFDSLLIFLSGFSMTLTPGKAGEFLKAFLVRQRVGTPVATTSPIILAERMTDGLALLILAGAGLLIFDSAQVRIVMLGVVVAATVVVLLVQRRALADRIMVWMERAPLLAARMHHIQTFYLSAYSLLKVQTADDCNFFRDSFVGGRMSCALALILVGLGIPFSWTLVALSCFAMGFATLAGSLLLVPGGLGVAEASIGGLLIAFGKAPWLPAGTITAFDCGSRDVDDSFCNPVVWFFSGTGLSGNRSAEVRAESGCATRAAGDCVNGTGRRRNAVIPKEKQENLTDHFDVLQKNLVPLWEFIGQPTQQEHTIVVVPSLSLDSEFHGSEQQAYEERFLFMLFLLQQPRVRMVYVTSMQISPTIVDYYLDLLPAVVASHRAQAPLSGCAAGFVVAAPLAQTARPPALAPGNSCAGTRPGPRAHLVPYNTTDLERELSVRLGIPMYAADPRFFAFGTKSGCRRIFTEEGVQHPLGIENLYSVDDMMSAIQQMRATKPRLSKVILKLNDEVSGQGNATVDLSGLEQGTPERTTIAETLRAMKFELRTLQYEEYIAKFAKRGGIAEEYITGAQLVSPSAQLRNTPLGEVELLSTHDQILGGPSGQSLLGLSFSCQCRVCVPRSCEKQKRWVSDSPAKESWGDMQLIL